MNDQPKRKRNRHFCSVFKMSKKKRGVMAQTNLDDLKRGDAHPSIDGLLFYRYNSNGSEAWVTLDELNEQNNKATARREANQTTKQRKAAERARKLKLKYDLEAESILLRFSKLGMPLEEFKKLPKPVRNRVAKACPDIVTTTEQRKARSDKQMDELKQLFEELREANASEMEAKMDALRGSQQEPKHDASFSELVAAQKAKSRRLTQGELNSMSRFSQ